MFTNLFERINIKQILTVGLLFRLIAVFFSRGYAFHDDHFEVIELVQKWRSGIPFTWGGSEVHMFSLLYPGIHYLLFSFCKMIGITEPQDMMIVVRFFHALVSMGGIYFGYLLALRLTNQKTTALIFALVMAIFWCFPFLSVRSLREFFCIPFLLAGTYYAVKERLGTKEILWAAFLFNLAFCIRLQTIFIPFGIGFFWFIRKHHLKYAIIFGISFIVFFFLTQGLFDWIHYGNPLASSLEYLNYNSDPEHMKGYPQGPWYMYFGTLALVTLGIPFIPLLIGYIRSARLSPQLLMLFISSLLFFVFHSLYSNKQERFILPFVPYFILLGLIGFRDYFQKNSGVAWLRIVTRFTIAWLIFFNTAGVFILSFTYSKRARVETMSYLKKKGDVTNIVIEGMTAPPQLPLFYLGKDLDYFSLQAGRSFDTLRGEILEIQPAPNYLIMAGNTNFDARLRDLKALFPKIRHEKDIKPGVIDNFSYLLNPSHNQNETWYIFRID